MVVAALAGWRRRLRDPWPSTSRRCSTRPAPHRHRAAGDTLYSIARAAGVPLRDLVRINGLRPYCCAGGSGWPAGATCLCGAGRRSLSQIAVRPASMRPDPPQRFVRALPLRVGQSLRLPLAAGAPPPPSTAPVVAAPPWPRRPRPAVVNGVAAAPRPRPAPRHVASPGRARREAAPRRLFSPPARAGSTFLTPVAGRVIGRFGPREGGLHNDGIKSRRRAARRSRRRKMVSSPMPAPGSAVLATS